MSLSVKEGACPPVNVFVKYAPDGPMTTSCTLSKAAADCHCTAALLMFGAFPAANAKPGMRRTTIRTLKSVFEIRDISSPPFEMVNENVRTRPHWACFLVLPCFTGRQEI